MNNFRIQSAAPAERLNQADGAVDGTTVCMAPAPHWGREFDHAQRQAELAGRSRRHGRLWGSSNNGDPPSGICAYASSEA